eukprot:scaffold1292_cov71-Cyclotella_meneghiniana.AAC.1
MQDVNNKRGDDDNAAVEHYYDGAVPSIQHYRLEDQPTGHNDNSNDNSQIELQQEEKIGGHSS